MRRRSVMTVGLLVLLAVGGVLVAHGVRSMSVFCTADGLLTEEPPGWDLRRDGANGCEWTLFNKWGVRAPESLYHEISIDAPPPIFVTPERTMIVGVIVIIGSLVGLVAVNHRRRFDPVDTG